MVLRKQMVRAKYLYIENERSTVISVIRGLLERQNLAQHVPILLRKKPDTINELMTTIEKLDTLEKPRRQGPRTGERYWNIWYNAELQLRTIH